MIVTARASCRTMLEGGIEHYNMDIALLDLTELDAEYLADDGAC